MINDSITIITDQSEREEAIPLITFDTKQRKFIINEHTESLLRALNGPIGIVSVAGMYRTGKSYLLNRMLLNRSNGFAVGPSINPCTKGLWVWSKPIKGTGPDGQNINVLIIDTEGIGATDEDQNHDSKIFTLAILLSSYFIYNSVGSIDENAIQNLSFIINITKNIQLHAKKEDVDLKEYANYLPSFVWVIRDFSLQLIHQDGEPMTSKEYLEKSLEPQKGYSEIVEQKNKIRTLIKEFFKDRDCVTMVRPLTDEEDLQNLERLDSNKLRFEFLEQISQLRKKVIHRMKPKSLNGKLLNGEMFCNLMISYVNAINNGAIPVIENAWSFMCKNECYNAMIQTEKNYLNDINEKIKLYQNFPFETEKLKRMHKEAKASSIVLYQRKAIGSLVDEYYTELTNKIKSHFTLLVNENERETEKQCNLFLDANYIDITNNLKENRYKSYSEFKEDIEEFVKCYKLHAPQGPKRDVYLYDFIINSVLNASESFNFNLEKEIERLKHINTDKNTKISLEVSELKMKLEETLISKNELIKKYESEKNEILSNENTQRESLMNFIKEKDTLHQEATNKYENSRKESEKQISDLKIKLEANEENLKEIERKLVSVESENDKEKSLLLQKIKFLEKNIEESKYKEQEHYNEIRIVKKESIITTKDVNEKFESQIKQLLEKIETIQETNIDLETKLLEKEKRLENQNRKYELNIKDLNEKLNEFKNKIKINDEEVRVSEMNMSLKAQELKQVYILKIEEITLKNEEMSKKIKESEDEFIQMRNKLNKEISLLKQKSEFLEIQLKENQEKVIEEKKSSETLIKIFEDKNNFFLKEREDLINQINEIKTDHMKEFSNMNIVNDKIKSEMQLRLDDLIVNVNEMEIKNKIEKEDYENKLKENLLQLTIYEKELTDLKEKYNCSENEKKSVLEECNSKLEKLEVETQMKLEQVLKQTRIEIEESNYKCEKTVLELKRHYELEREKINETLNEEKDNFNQKTSEIENYYKEKVKNLEISKENEIKELQEQIEDMEINHKNYIIYCESEFSVKNQEIETLNSSLKKAEESFTNFLKISYQEQSDRFDKENNLSMTKINELNQEINKLERNNGVLSSKKEQLETQLEQLKLKIELIESSYQEEKKELTEKIQSLQNKIQSQYDQILIINAESSKESALKKQEINFLNNKIQELTKVIDSSNEKFEEKLKNLQTNFEIDSNFKISRLNKEREELEMKLIQKKKELKEMELNFSKEKAMLEKEKAVLNEKLSNTLIQKEELCEALERERQEVNRKIHEAKNDSKRDNELIIKENEFMKNRLKKLDQDFSEMQADYEKDSDLWKTKFEFLEEQKNQSKKDLIEFQKKHETILENLQKRGTTEKDKFSFIQNAIVLQVEERYKNQLREMQENYNKKLEENDNRKKELQSEIFTLNTRINNNLEKNKDFSEINKKLLSAVENELKIKKEMQSIKEENDKILKNFQNLLETEKNSNKEKIIELENKCREYESKKSYLTFDNIKEKALNEKEKENKQQEIEKLNQRINELERINGKLSGEVRDLLKDTKRSKSRKPSVPSIATPSNNNSSYLPKYYRYTTNNKENRNHINTSFDNTNKFDRLDSLSLNKPKFSSRLSQKSDDDCTSNISNS